MRQFGFFHGAGRRNDNFQLEDPHPVPRYRDDTHTGRVALDGYELLSKADPDRAGSPPSVKGTVGVIHRGPDQSFEH